MKKIKHTVYFLCLFSFLFSLTNCKGDGKSEKTEEEISTTKSEIDFLSKENYGTTANGEKVEQYTLTNEAGMEVKIITYGGRITSLKVPDKNDEFEDVILGFDSLSQYTSEHPYFGALIGRYGNRIAEGKFSLDGEEYQLPQNDGENSLHGGDQGFDKVIWTAEVPSDSTSLILKYTSKDGEMGYPGNLDVTVTYTLNEDNSLDVAYEAESDKKTIVNLTQHSYFNLTGNFEETILDHEVVINADEFLPVDETLIPTGELRKVEGTPFDFTEAKKVGKEIETENEQLQLGKGYDHCWVLNDQSENMHFAASAYDPESGRFLEVSTTEPGIQFYTGNFLDGTLPRQGGEGTYAQRSGFCLETQHYPDSPNQEKFPSVVLNPGEKYNSKTTFKFSVK
ncbi:aldose epimerase family protein [Zunongwangia sp. HRR-M8]|uniref:aldose epimerase family protein n=1 Tax=Zunongwangia sp. HRR-M8 TaxID=3015170 RepID=UPI0022DD1776|nr:aldose epimerase family protein [Zunongwangia sp. HRR-M8]WBL23782.1 galactose mutarotase [Zunongwangia sp. HRR-M8]